MCQFITKAGAPWLLLRRLLDALWLLRLSVACALVAALLAINDQFRELARIASEGEGWIGLIAATCFANLSIWYGARTTLDHGRVGDALPTPLIDWLPRILGFCVVLAVTMVVSAAGSADPGRDAALAWLIFVCGLASSAFTVYRRPLLATVASRLGPAPDGASRQAGPKALVRDFLDLPMAEARAKDLAVHGQRDLSCPTRIVHLLAIAATLVAFALAICFPGFVAGFGPFAILLGALGMLNLAGTLPVLWASRHRVPLLTLVFLWAMLLSWTGCSDNHRVRTEPFESPAPPAASASGMSKHVAAWLSRHDASQCPTILLVSSEGGGIRAAMWTALVFEHLDALHARRGLAGLPPSRCVLAASGVSGGSLGLAAILGRADASRGDPATEGQKVSEALQRDFLAPVMVAMFGPDLLHRVLPLPGLPDRGEALERAWIDALGERFDRRLAELSADPDSPVLLLNTTRVHDGIRVIQHGFSQIEGFAEHFHGALDGSTTFGPSLPLAAAVLNSARFTLVSPAGSYRPGGKPLQQFVDGGYFENSGAATLGQFRHWLLTQFRRGFGQETELADCEQITGRLHWLHLSNDPGVRSVTGSGHPGPSCSHFGELHAPLEALLQTREQRGEMARRTLASEIGEGNATHLTLAGGDEPDGCDCRLLPGLPSSCPGCGLESPASEPRTAPCQVRGTLPLGWTLGAASVQVMREQLACFETRGELDRILGAKAPAAARAGKTSDPPKLPDCEDSLR